VLTGGTSGVYYPLGVALSEIYAEGIDESRTQVQTTKASVENLNLLAQGRGEIAFALGDSVQAAWESNEEAGFPRKLEELRAIAAIYPNYIQIVADASAQITTQDDLGEVEYLSFAKSGELIKNRQLQTTLQSSGLGVAFIKDLSSTHDISIVAIPEATVQAIGASFVPAVIPAGTYTGQDQDVPTAAVGNMLISHDGVSDETAYQMTKLLFENLDRMKSAHAAANGIATETALDGISIPLHPGAERYYREIGLIE
jgi:TRAP-type uncharacterized transport system substrate-binding protein